MIAMSISSIFALSGVAQDPHAKSRESHAASAVTHAGGASQEVPAPTHGVAVMMASKGQKVSGVLQLQETDEGVHVWGEIKELTPGEHGFHIHEFGDLRSDDGTATGSHFSSPGHAHGDINTQKGHEGDFGNITADDKGVAKIDLVAHGMKLQNVLGRAFVVHAGKDDLMTQPSGNSGARIGVALIGVAKAPEPKK